MIAGSGLRRARLSCLWDSGREIILTWQAVRAADPPDARGRQRAGSRKKIAFRYLLFPESRV